MVWLITTGADGPKYDYTFEMTVKKAGKIIVTGRLVISADGKSRTVTTSATGSDGKKVENTAVYDKQ